MYIRSKRIYTSEGIKDGYLVIQGKKIVGFLDASAKVSEYEDYTNEIIIPGIFDTHCHAAMGYSPRGDYYGDIEVKKFLKGVASMGVSLIFPTIAKYDDYVFERLARLMDEEIDGAKMLGIHSEDTDGLGHRVGEKGKPITNDRIDMDLVKGIYESSCGKLKLCGIAPELAGSKEAIEYLTQRGVKVAFMHSEADYQTALDSFKNGITISTHTANVMRGIHHRHMGGLGACLLDKDLYNEIICDFLHLSKEMITLMFKAKNDMSKWIMISDNASIACAGAPAGRYTGSKGSLDANVFNISEEGFCLTNTGRLSGSTKPILFGIKNLVTELKMPLEEVIKLASYNPCQFYGFKEKGAIKIGNDCDLTIIDNDFNCISTYTEGKKVYDKIKDKECFNPEWVKLHKVEV